MIYDYAIIGAGVAGPVCAYQLAQNGKRCILFEKNSIPSEKICGGGVSYKALQSLRKIGIQTKLLFGNNSKSIQGHVIHKADGLTMTKIYSIGKVSLGIQRNIFDLHLLNCALKEGVSICYGYSINDVAHVNDLYNIDNYWVKHIIWATGARNVQGNLVTGQSIGYSGQICAKSKLEPYFFHYWYYDKSEENKYFWVFPIGHNLWNVGIWSRSPFIEMKKEYSNCLEKFFLDTVNNKWDYYRLPKGEFLGHIDQRQSSTVFSYGVGDFAGACNPLNGGGIIGAINSSIELAHKISR